MMSRFFRLFALFSLMMMPFTMASAPAGASSVDGAMAGMSDERCAGHEDEGALPAVDMTQCLLMCAALPASEPLRIASPSLPRTPLRLTRISPIHGIVLDTATPPPRRA